MHLLTIFMPISIFGLFIISLIFNIIPKVYSLFLLLLYFSLFLSFILSISIVYEVIYLNKHLKQIVSVVSLFLSDMWNFSKFYISFFLGILLGIYYLKNVGWYAAGDEDISFFKEPIFMDKNGKKINFYDGQEAISSEFKFIIIGEPLRYVELHFIASFFDDISKLNIDKEMKSKLVTLEIDSISTDNLLLLFNKFFDSLKTHKNSRYFHRELVLPYEEYCNLSMEFKVNVLGISSLFINEYTDSVLPLPLNYVNINLSTVILEKIKDLDKFLIDMNTMEKDYETKYSTLAKRYNYLGEEYNKLMSVHDDTKNNLIILEADINKISLENINIKKENEDLSSVNETLRLRNETLRLRNETLWLRNESLSSESTILRVENEELREKLNRGFFSNFFNFVPKLNFFPTILNNLYTINHSIMENFRGFFSFFRR